ncbi:Hypothetical protein PHPALM_20701 [Phytophthora palmivora]|uniref:Transmembrane protein n=1 Tax=Phytophthora palmivora TaxID=4796 RepID=A0A2P4XE70_9STRA|nr:Hypothetical protein PHPALM_20701 [Phytophthora palmivora]
MRMRLRAPDEPEADDFGDGTSSAPSTPEHNRVLPPLDVGSPEYIEERLENLKRRPNWGDFLDQYVEDHPDSDSDSESGDLESILVSETPGFIRSVLWSLLVVALAPLLIMCSPCLRHKGYGFWPLGCRSIKELFSCAVGNVTFILFGLVLLYWTICRELPDVFNVNNTLIKLNVQIDEAQRRMDTCHSALLEWERAVAQELCMPVGIDAGLLLANVWLLLHFHRRWARSLMTMMAVMYVVDVPTKMYDATFPAPEIQKVDPTFALVDEELLVAVDGKNLKPGGSIAWVAYWGCAITSNVDACDKQFISTFEAGNVAVTFKSLDHFIPCYRDPPNPLKAQDYQCFDNVRIRVKDKQSIPGWSRSVPLASVSQTTLSNDERQLNLEFPTFKHKEQMHHDVMKSSYRTARSIESDVSTNVASSPNPLRTGSGGESVLKKDDAEMSKGGAQDNDSLYQISMGAELETVTPEASIAAEKLKEVEVTSDVLFHVNNELESAYHSEDDVSYVESSQEAVTETKELQSSSQVKVGKVGAIPENKIQEHHALVVESDVQMIEEVRIIDEEIKESSVAVVHEDVQMVPADNEVEVEKNKKTSTYDDQSEKVSTSAVISQEDEAKKSYSKQEAGTSAHVKPRHTESQVRPRDSKNDGTQPERISKTRKTSKRKGQRSHQSQKASEPTIMDTTRNTAAAV